MAKAKRGRPAKGPKGAKVSDFVAFSVRLAPEVKALLYDIAKLERFSMNDLIGKAIGGYARTHRKRHDRIEAANRKARRKPRKAS